MIAILIINAESFKVITANEVAATLFGYKSKQDLIDNFDSKYHYINQTERENNRNIVLTTGEFADKILELKKIDGSLIWVKTYSTLTRETNTIETALTDITIQVKAQKELAAKITELENANKELESFNFISSHDLQEPLRKIQNFAGLLNQELNISGDAKYYLKELYETSRKLRRLIDDLLEYSRLKKANPNFERTNIKSIVEETITSFKESLDEKKRTLLLRESARQGSFRFSFENFSITF